MNGIADLYKLADVAAGQPSPMMLFPIGDWTSEKYPSLSLTQELADEVLANFESKVLRTKVPVEMTGFHSEALAPAAGWVDRVYQAPFEWQGVSGEALYADWTPNVRGSEAVNDGQYAYDSIDLATHIDPVDKTTTRNVLKGIALTNRPVLRMMPSLKDAGDSIKFAERIEVQLSEVTLAGVPEPDPVQSILDDMDALAARADAALKGRKGIPVFRTMMAAARAKVGAHLTEDPDGNPVADDPASSDGSSQSAKADEGHEVTLDEGDPVPKGSDLMKSVALKLNLSEDADEALVLAEVVKLEERTIAAETALAEAAKAKHDSEVEAQLSELSEAGNLTPAEKEKWLAEPDMLAGRIDGRKDLPKYTIVDFDEHGTHKGGNVDGADPAADLSQRAMALAEEKGIDLAEAMSIEITKSPGFAEQRHAELAERIARVS
jgi:hypothetical protein